MEKVIIWNKTTRIIHWCIAIPVGLNFFIDGGDLSHKIIGYVALAAMLFRLLWGIMTKDQANFKSFPLSLKEVSQFIVSLKKNNPLNYPGHNPLASWVYFFIWALVGLLSISGFMLGLDAFWGEEWLEKLHGQISNLLYVLIIFHILGLVFDSIKHKRKTWLGMISGKR